MGTLTQSLQTPHPPESQMLAEANTDIINSSIALFYVFSALGVFIDVVLGFSYFLLFCYGVGEPLSSGRGGSWFFSVLRSGG